jgi:hypothetical protein
MDVTPPLPMGDDSPGIFAFPSSSKSTRLGQAITAAFNHFHAAGEG